MLLPGGRLPNRHASVAHPTWQLLYAGYPLAFPYTSHNASVRLPPAFASFEYLLLKGADYGCGGSRLQLHRRRLFFVCLPYSVRCSLMTISANELDISLQGWKNRTPRAECHMLPLGGLPCLSTTPLAVVPSFGYLLSTLSVWIKCVVCNPNKRPSCCRL